MGHFSIKNTLKMTPADKFRWKIAEKPQDEIFHASHMIILTLRTILIQKSKKIDSWEPF